MTLLAAAPGASALPRVIVLATGGTMAGEGTVSTHTTAYNIGGASIEHLLRSVPAIHQIACVEGKQIGNIGSDNMTTATLLGLARRINQLLTQSDLDGIVLTHGTDTIEETAYFLNLVVRSDKPVVFTGAMRPATALNADGPMNLYQAVLLAGRKDAHGRGTTLMMNDRIQSGRYVTKTHTTAMDAFKAPEEGSLGRIVGNEIYFESRLLKRHTTQTPFDVSDCKSLPHEDISYAYQDDRAFLYDAVVEHGAKGIVVAGMDAGTLSSQGVEGAERAIRKEVVRASRTGAASFLLTPIVPACSPTRSARRKPAYC